MTRLIFLCLFIFVHHLVFSQNGNRIELSINYESPIDTTFTNETKNIFQQILNNIPANEEVEKIRFTAFCEHRYIGEDRMAAMLLFFEKQGIELGKIEVTTQYYQQEQVKIDVLLKKKLEESQSESPNPIQVPKEHHVGKSKNAQVFEIQPYSDVNIQGIEGTKLSIHRSDLMYENGAAVEGIIKVELKEFYKPEDILLAGLQTLDGDKILETGGMLNLKITADNEPLVLKEGKTAKVQLPATNAKAKTGMNLYLGTELEDGAVDWKREMSKNDSDSKSFQFNSYVRIKELVVLDSITYKPASISKLKSNHYPLEKTKSISHTHTEEYFDLELPYIPTPPPATRKVDWGGIWVNVDRKFSIGIDLPSIDPPPPPSTDILVQIPKIENEFFPRVALMLKDRSVFLSGKLVPNHQDMNSLSFVFERVPLEQEVAIVAFLDTGQSILYASKDLKTEKKTPDQRLEMKVLESGNLQGTLAELAN